MTDWRDDSLGLDWNPTPPMEAKPRLTRSREQRVVSGVCGGVAEHFNLDPIVVRLAAVVLAVTTGGWTLAAYLIASCAIPLQRVDEYSYASTRDPRQKVSRGRAGWMLIGVGAIVLLNALNVDLGITLAVVMVVVGINMVVRHRK